MAQEGFSLHKWHSNVNKLEKDIGSDKISISNNMKILEKLRQERQVEA